MHPCCHLHLQDHTREGIPPPKLKTWIQPLINQNTRTPFSVVPHARCSGTGRALWCILRGLGRMKDALRRPSRVPPRGGHRRLSSVDSRRPRRWVSVARSSNCRRLKCSHFKTKYEFIFVSRYWQFGKSGNGNSWREKATCMKWFAALAARVFMFGWRAVICEREAL